MDRRRFLLSSVAATSSMLAIPGCGGGSEDQFSSNALSSSAVMGATALTGFPQPSAATVSPASWVPEPGGLAIVMAANGWRDADPCPKNDCQYRIGSGPEWNKVINDYSGGVYNPWWGEYGALMFHGGGHSATNDNSVAVLDFNDLSFKLVADPSRNVTLIRPMHGPDYAGFEREHGEYRVDGKPASAHTYDSLVVLPPAITGAPYGSLVRPFGTAVHYNLSRSFFWAHKLDLRTRNVGSEESRSANSWSRWSVNGDQTFPGAGGCAAYDPLRNRVWWFGVPSTYNGRICYLDCNTREQVRVKYAGGDPLFEVSRPIMHYIPDADLLVAIGPWQGTLRAYFFRPDAPTGWTPIVFSETIPLDPRQATPWVYVPELGRIVLFSSGDRSAMYEIEIPAVRTSAWPVTRRPFASGAQLMYSANIVGKRFAWSSALRCIVYKPLAETPALNQFYAYRPYGV